MELTPETAAKLLPTVYGNVMALQCTVALLIERTCDDDHDSFLAELGVRLMAIRVALQQSGLPPSALVGVDGLESYLSSDSA